MTTYTDSLIGYAAGTITDPVINFTASPSNLPVFTVGSTSTYTRIQRFNSHPNPRAGVDLSFMQYNAPSATVTFTRAIGLTTPIATITTGFSVSVSSGTPAYMDVRNVASALPVNGYSSYNFSAYAREIAGANTGTLGVYVQWISGDGSTIIRTDSQLGITTTSGTWTRVEAALTPPTNTYYAIFIVRGFAASTFSTGNAFQATGFLVEGTS